MPTRDAGNRRRPADRWDVFARGRATVDALERLISGLGTGVLALVTVMMLVATALTSVIGVGVLLAPAALHGLRAVANRERSRLSDWGHELVIPEPVPDGLRAALADRTVRRELVWVVTHASFGLFLGSLGLTVPIRALQDATFWAWWWLLPPGEASDGGLGLWTVDDVPSALAIVLVAPVWIAITMTFSPAMAWLQAWPGRRLLAPDPDDLGVRVAQLTATRAAALDAHATELRRIERSLHDGTQNRLVAVNVLVGAARRAVARNPAAAEDILDQAHGAAEQALAELRGVVRSILPPVLAERSLADALDGLATTFPLPCSIDADIPVRCAMSVEATAYFVVAEALTNIAKHSGARRAHIRVRRHDDLLHVEVIDDGKGGADENSGSGIGGIRRRTEAHDGTFVFDSPPGGPTTLRVSLPCGT
ncbi:sensor histidine kinase [Nonomuraea diastatica]|uniref:histidine kinase n=1 Tax=Nonomuraea diastatica TaxID=1848329 RepID=A0A4R4X6C0_9ACTN|nr:sensor domain-containing protein [Nonomuraea diastatica]TDD25956.1 sensor histidine kinase [Nonomuraea diastatica]